MTKLSDHFERVIVISLPQREDRRRRLKNHLTKTGLARGKDIHWLSAVDGKKASIPEWWHAGPGAWGCRASQLKALQSAQNDGLANVLILEDDVTFHPRASSWLEETAPLLPPNWDFFFLGGQHLIDPLPTEHPKLLQGRFITRTHAYAVNQRSYSSIIAQVEDENDYREHSSWHIDHQYGHYQQEGKWQSYAPAWWLAGQDSGVSDISPLTDPQRWWPAGKYQWQLPFIQVPVELRNEKSLYFCEAPLEKSQMKLALFLRDTATEAFRQGKLPACNLPDSTLKKLWSAGTINASTLPTLQALADYPANHLFNHPFNDPLSSPMSRPKDPTLRH